MSADRTVMGDFNQFVQHHLHGVEWSLNGTLALLWRRWAVIATCTLVMVTAALLLLTVTPPQFTAQSMLQINTRQEQVMKIDDVVGGLNTTDAAIRTEIDVLKSRKLAQRVIEELKLLNHPDFSSGPGLAGSLYGAVRGLVFPMSDEEKAASADARMSRAINAFLDRLDVNLAPRSFSIQVRFTTHDAELSAKIVNALAQAYLTSQLEDRLDAARRATGWMSDRAKQLQKRLQAAEMAVQKFREENNLTTAKGLTLNEQQTSELNSQLILARAQLAEAGAKATGSAAIRGGRLETTSEVLNSPLIQNLRIQETEVRRKMSDLAARYGERHPRMLTVRNELADVQRKIAEESSKIRGSLQNDVDVAKARVATFEEQLSRLQTEGRLNNDAAVQLAELERQAESERSLYESFLNRSKEVAQMDFAQSDARVIYAAEVPLAPSSPNKPLILAIALVLGMGMGVALVLLLEALDSGFRTAQQLEKAVALPVLGMLGELPHVKGEHSDSRANYVTEKPTSAFTESVRAVRTALGFAKPDANVQVLLVTSSVPQEGKSMFAASLAQVAAMGEQKVVLIDADMRRPTQARNFSLQPKAGLAELLAGKVALKDVLQPIKGTNMWVLPALPNTQFSQELLGSEKMKALIAALRKEYGTIVIDSPPVMAVADAMTLSNLADASLYMVRWGTTPRPLAMGAVKQLQSTQLGVTGVVMTRVDLERQRAYGMGDYGYYYGKYKDYYTE